MSSILDARNVAKTTGRKVVRVVKFPRGDTFEAYHDAEQLLKSEGYHVGSMCFDKPTAAAVGCSYVAKWYNIAENEWSRITAMIVGADYRTRGVMVCFLQ